MTDAIGATAKTQQRADVFAAMKSASDATGVDFNYLVKTAQRESNFDPGAKATTSSATGLFQFTNETWLNVLDRYGDKHGIKTDGLPRTDLLALRKDANLSSLMAGELAKENAGILAKKLGRPATSAELYTAHFMGPSDAARLVKAARHNAPGAAADTFPEAALANANVFHGSDGANLTAAQLYAKLTGADIATADKGEVAPAGLVSPTQVSNTAALLQARLGATTMSSSLMAALFSFQGTGDNS